MSGVATSPVDGAFGPVPQEQLDLPIDQFQRYLLTSRAIQLLEVPTGGRILDLGGAPGPIELFLPDHEVTVLDIQGEHPGGRFVIADGGALPFADGAFDAVVSLDTLEHVPTSVRAAFLSEARRVSLGSVVLSAPFNTPGVPAAERALKEFITARLAADFPTAVWLQEHVDWGLPELDATLGGLTGGPWVSDAFPSGYLPRWLATMVVDHELLATGLPDLNGLHAYYNEHVSPHDARTPAYRHIVAASCVLSRDELSRRLATLRSAPQDSPETTAHVSAMASTLLQHRLGQPFTSPELRATQAELARVSQQVHDLERVVVDREAHLARSAEHIASLEAQIARRDQMTTSARVRGLVRRTVKGRLG